MSRSPLLSRPKWLIYSMALAIVSVDQLGKFWAESSLVEGQAQPLVGSLLQLRLIYNPGAAFSLLTDATWVFTVVSSAFTLGVLWFASRVKHRGIALALGSVLGGAVGNLIDRLFREPGFGTGYVVDFLELPNWPVFNFADMGVFFGVGALLVFLYRGYDLDGTRTDSKSPRAAGE